MFLSQGEESQNAFHFRSLTLGMVVDGMAVIVLMGLPHPPTSKEMIALQMSELIRYGGGGGVIVRTPES